VRASVDCLRCQAGTWFCIQRLLLLSALHDRLRERLKAGDEDVFAHLYLSDRPLKLGAVRVEEIAEAVAGRHMSESTEALRFAGAD
jgi:hypothetical protein